MQSDNEGGGRGTALDAVVRAVSHKEVTPELRPEG